MKRFFSLTLCLVIILTSIAATVVVSSAAAGDNASKPANAKLGSTYKKEWTSSTYDQCYYVKFKISEQGIVTIKAKKPCDDNGNFGNLYIDVYKDNNQKVASTKTAYSKGNADSYYELSAGLEAGTYIFTIQPGFKVTSGVISTEFSVSHKPAKYCEIEPNESDSTATSLSSGEFNIGYFGKDGGSFDGNDYYKFNVTEGHTYRVTFKNFDTIYQTTTAIDVEIPGSAYSGVGRSSILRNTDENGNNYCEFKAKKSGVAYLRLHNYSGVRYEYEFVVADRDANGWAMDGENWIYYRNGMKLKNRWVQDSKGWCYLDADGIMVTNTWAKDSVGDCYIGPEGYVLTNRWLTQNGQWYYLDGNGRKVCSQWRKDSKGWCYLNADGVMATNTWVKDSMGWCYIGSDGYIVTNQWVKDSAGWHYLGADGKMVTNAWAKDNTGWCYLNAKGDMVKNSWVKDGGKEYYLGADGYMYKSRWVYGNGNWYYVDYTGAKVKSQWIKDSNGWCYLGADGIMVTNGWVSDSVGPCYIGSEGYILTYQWIKIDGDWAYLNGNGRVTVNSWISYSGYWYYVDSKGCMLTGKHTIDGVDYVFDNSGRLVG
ncbi:MAG: N-acetylmuramoyl-L-alanine amidase family protein [Clostridia bacterium]|nr:N-acetylmuramoyl-L-alanine amidase family protein [Clostridia bacterium]